MNTCYNPYSLVGKTILVTGASSGIGKATAIECSKIGAKLIITGRDNTRLKETFNSLNGDQHKMISADLTIEEELKYLICKLPKIHGAVMCAGINKMALIQFCSPKKFESTFDTNFFAQAELIRLILKNNKLEDSSSIVVISSIASFCSSLGNSMYGASKAALSRWVKYAARELAGKNIRLNTICPGMIDTNMIHGQDVSEEQLEEDMKKYPLGRYGQPEEIAYGAIYLLSDAANWITGIDLIIDGGITV